MRCCVRLHYVGNVANGSVATDRSARLFNIDYIAENFRSSRTGLVAQNHAQQRTADLYLPIVVDKAELPKFVHEEAHPRLVVPTISASIFWLIFVVIGSGHPSLPKFASSRRVRAKRFSLELNRWSTRSASTRLLRVNR